MRYDYECMNDECGFLFEVEQRVTARKMRKCPMCSKKSLDRVMLAAPLGFASREATTIGQLAERNSKAMGEHGVRMAEEQNKREQEYMAKRRMDNIQKHMPGAKLLGIGNTDKPWYGKLDKDIQKKINTDATGEKSHKYIMTGKA